MNSHVNTCLESEVPPLFLLMGEGGHHFPLDTGTFLVSYESDFFRGQNS